METTNGTLYASSHFNCITLNKSIGNGSIQPTLLSGCTKDIISNFCIDCAQALHELGEEQITAEIIKKNTTVFYKGSSAGLLIVLVYDLDSIPNIVKFGLNDILVKKYNYQHGRN